MSYARVRKKMLGFKVGLGGFRHCTDDGTPAGYGARPSQARAETEGRWPTDGSVAESVQSTAGRLNFVNKNRWEKIMRIAVMRKTVLLCTAGARVFVV